MLPMLQYKKTAHALHFILALLTGGLWILPWILFAIANANHNSRVDQSMMLLMMGNRNQNQNTQSWS